ncbi:MAG: signal peptidase I [Candidatus Margulisbacteria bacterium GWF2_35_9]|nr:MAG: signal peptidase I [Candidatus Margulisbacteria bacterium GWF2_35_9]
MKVFLKNVLTILIAIAIALFIKSFIVEFHLIPTGSMIPNINVGDRVIVNKSYFGIQNPLYEAKQKKSIMLLVGNPLYKKNMPFSKTKYIFRFNKQIHRFDVVVFFPPEEPILGREYHFNNDPFAEPVYFQPPSLIGERYVKRVIGLPGDVLQLTNGVVYINGEKLVENQKQNIDYNDFGPVKIPEGHYFMMGDNRPRSSDSRVWGIVPENNILGRAWFVIWPLSAIKLIK